jgi:hypothetical protein
MIAAVSRMLSFFASGATQAAEETHRSKCKKVEVGKGDLSDSSLLLRFASAAH